LYFAKSSHKFSSFSNRFQIISSEVPLCHACSNAILSQDSETTEIAQQSATHKIKAILSLI
jgi:hypothetical protein